MYGYLPIFSSIIHAGGIVSVQHYWRYRSLDWRMFKYISKEILDENVGCFHLLQNKLQRKGLL